MPFKSEKQRRFLWKKHPTIARDWTKKHGSKVVKKEGGKIMKRQGYKHGKYVKVPTPHADINKYVTKRGVVEGPEGEDTYWRRKDSTMKIKKKKKSAGPAAGRSAERPPGGWTS